jgi:hypothetical protein
MMFTLTLLGADAFGFGKRASDFLHHQRRMLMPEGKPMNISGVVEVAVIASFFLSVPALTQEKKIQRSDLPPAVEKTVAAQSQGTTIRGFSQEKENGQTFYEAELRINGHSKDVLMNAQGAVVGGGTGGSGFALSCCEKRTAGQGGQGQARQS